MNYIKLSFMHSFGALVYIVVVASIMFNIEKWMKPEDTIMAPIAFLLLFVLSAAVVGSLVLGKPIMLFLNGSKSEAVKLFVYTLGWLLVYTIIAILLNVR